MNKYRVFVSTEPDLKGQCKRFKVESNLGLYGIQSLVEKIVKDTYYVFTKEGWKGGSRDVIPFDEMLSMVKDLRFYKKSYEKKLITKFEYAYDHLHLASALSLRRWRTEDVPGYRNRTFFEITSDDPTVKPDIEGIIERFYTNCKIEMHQSKTSNIIWTFDNIKLAEDYTVDGITDYFVYEAHYEWITEETKIEI